MASVTSDHTDVGAPQEAINEFWENLITKKPAKVIRIFPETLFAHLIRPPRKSGTATGKNAADSYEAAAAECRARVKRVVKECTRTNEKFTDADFDIEDLNDQNCLQGLQYWYKDKPTAATSSVTASQLGSALSTLVQSQVMLGDGAPLDFNTTAKVLSNMPSESSEGPESVHRIDWIFDEPRFEIDGFTSSDLVQGSTGDCWFIAAVATICSNPELINKVCVDRNEECGVYGFVFYRDGEWIWTVIDDNLYLKNPDFDAWGDRYDPTNAKEMKYKKNHQTGSEALYFASCADENETWLPLLEKAYAKVHGDYDAIAGGSSGEAVEDLTGGVTTKIMTDRVLSKDRLWKELLQVNKQFLFSASSPGSYGDDSDSRRGLALSHAYSVLKAVEAEGPDGKQHRLVLIRNPWGKRANASMGEWTGPWSDGSREWSPYWLDKLQHKFGDDGLFWMSYQDLLRRFDLLERTRLFDAAWTVVQRWTSVSVAWVTGYMNTKFSVEIKKAGPTVFVLCQLDERYFKGLEGKYDFDLHFILQEKNAVAGEHIVRARGAWFGNRSISAEVDLEVGTYEVLPKIEASQDADRPEVPQVVAKLAERNPQKLRQIGLNYDIANAKGACELSEEERKKREQKKEEAAEKEAKEKEAQEKEKSDFEAWKKEEKAEYEAWKREKKQREDKEKAMQEAAAPKTPKKELKDDETQTDTTTTTTSVPTADIVKPEQDTPASSETADANKPDISVDLSIRPKDPTVDNDASVPASVPTGAESNTVPLHSPTTANKVEHAVDQTTPTAEHDHEREHQHDHNHEHQHAHNPDFQLHHPYPHPSSPPPEHYHPSSTRYPPPPGPGSVYCDPEPLPPPPPQKRGAVKEYPKPWNAVCVLGLRVYSQDADVSIQLVKPRDVEEGAILDVDGDTPAGATM